MTAAGIARPAAGRGAGRLQTLVILAISVIVLGTLAYVATGPGAADGVTEVQLDGISGKAPAVGDPPPAFSGAGFDGSSISLADYAGKPLWLTFGASWCPDCRSEAPDVQAVYDAYRDRGLSLLGVFIREDGAAIGGYAERAGLTFPIVVDERAAIATVYQTLGIPTHYFIGADGVIRQVRIGAMSRADMEQAVSALLASN